MTAALRNMLPTDYGAASASAAKTGGGSSGVAVLADMTWLGDLAEADRLAVFSSVLDGNVVLAVEYAHCCCN